jgi:type I restriction enzyme S subunit
VIWTTEDLLPEWPLKSLSTLASKVGSGATPRGGRSSYPDHGIPLIRSQNVHFEGFKLDGLAFLTDEQARQLDNAIVRQNDVLLNITGASIGRVCLAPKSMEGARVNQHVCIIRSTEVRPAFLASYIASPQVQEAIVQGNYGVTREALTKAQVLELPVPVPPISEQDALSSLIDKIADHRHTARTHLDRALQTIERFRQSVSAAACAGRLTADWREENDPEWSSDQLLAAADQRRRDQLGRRYREPQLNRHAMEIDHPESWSIAPLGVLLEGIKYGTSMKSIYGGVGVAVLRIPNISGAHLDLSDLKFANLPRREIEDLALRSSDLLMIRSNGSPHLVGRCAAVGTEGEGMAYAGYLMRLRVDSELCDPLYLALAMASPGLRNQVEMPLRSTSGVNNINTDEVRGLAIPLPSLVEQHEIVGRAKELLQLSDGLGERVERARRSIDGSSRSILGKALRGELIGGAL